MAGVKQPMEQVLYLLLFLNWGLLTYQTVGRKAIYLQP